MNSSDLDAEVINLLRKNKKIAAIKLLRAKESIGLKEAKLAVDDYLSQQPDLSPVKNENSGHPINSLLFIIAVACVLYLGYDYFSTI